MSYLSPQTAMAFMSALDWVSQGHTPTDACRKAGMSTLMFDKLARDPSFETLAQDAFRRGADALADILLNIDSNELYGSTDAKIMKIKSDNIKWYLSKRASVTYGEKITVENTFTADKAITEALARGKERAQKVIGREVREQAAGQIIDLVAVEVVEPFDPSRFM